MTLGDILRNLATFPDEGTIVAEEPWWATSRARICQFDPDTLVKDMETDGMTYFLEVFVALEVRESLTASGWDGEEALCQGLIFYAANDAYPQLGV